MNRVIKHIRYERECKLREKKALTVVTRESRDRITYARVMKRKVKQ